MRPIFSELIPSNQLVPYAQEPVAAGFPNYAADIKHEMLSLDELCLPHPHSSFIVRVQGTSMIDKGVLDGDYLCVDRSRTATHNSIVVAELNGEFTVKELKKYPVAGLQPHNPDYSFIPITEEDEFRICGVVVAVVRPLS